MKSQRQSAVVSQTVTMFLIDGDGTRSAVNVELSYDARDPFAVSATFLTSQPVTWTFARDLLATGIYEPNGDGDVHVWPCLSANGSAVVIVELSSPEGSIMIESSLRDVSAFLRAANAAVPPGTESRHLNIDAALLTLLGAR